MGKTSTLVEKVKELDSFTSDDDLLILGFKTEGRTFLVQIK